MPKTTNAEEAQQFCEDLQDILQLIPKTKQNKKQTNKHKKPRCLFHDRGLDCKSRKSRDTWNNRKIWPWSTK